MFKLDNGMIIKFCSGNIGIVLDSHIECKSSCVQINDESMNRMLCGDIEDIIAVELVYRPDDLHTLDSLLDLNNYTEDDIIWERDRTFIEGVAYYFGTTEVAKKYNVFAYVTYLYINGKLNELDDCVIPYLDVEVVNVE